MGGSRLSAISVSIVLFAGLVAGSGAVSNATALEQMIDFTVTVSQLGISGGFAANLEYASETTAEKGSVAEISYSLSAASGSLTINIPLSYFSSAFYHIDDVPITIPLPETPIGDYPIHVLNYIPATAAIPSNLADVSVVLQGAIAAKTVSCNSGQGDVITPLSSLKWTSWGSKSMQIQTHEENPSVDIMTVFAYTLGIGITASVLGVQISLLGMTELSAVSGTPIASTTVLAVDSFPTALLVIGIFVASAMIGGYLYARRSQRIAQFNRSLAPLPPAMSPPSTMTSVTRAVTESPHQGGARKIPKPAPVMRHSFCSLDGAPLRSDGFCPKCGRYFRD